MASEPSNLRHLFGETPASSIDVSSVIRRSRARRAPRLLGAGAVAVLAIGGLAYGGFSGLSGLGGVSTASDSGGAAPMEDSDSELWSTADDSNAAKITTVGFCGSPTTPLAVIETGLELSVDFPAVAKVGAASVGGVATLTNTGQEPVVGSTFAAPMITLSRDDTVVWHSFPNRKPLPLDLDPGESIAFEASFSPAVCGPEDDLNGAMRDELPAVPAGDYEVFAETDVYSAAGTTLVRGPSQAITLE